MSEKEKIGLIDGDQALALLKKYDCTKWRKVQICGFLIVDDLKSCRVPLQPAKADARIKTRIEAAIKYFEKQQDWCGPTTRALCEYFLGRKQST